MTNKILLYTFLAVGMLMLNACGEKKQPSDVIIADKYVPKQLQAPVRMPDVFETNTVKWQGQPYQVEITRKADDSLSMLRDDDGQEYVDNRIELNIKRQDGSSFFQQTFTKATFTPYLDGPFKKNGQLASIRFDEVDNSAMEFVVVVCLPGAVDDLFVPLELTVDRQGSVRIELDNDMDMLDYDVDDADD